MYRPPAIGGPSCSSQQREPPLRVYFTTSTLGTTVSHRFECESLPGGGTRLKQTVFITAPPLLNWYVLATARKAHEEGLAVLPKVIGT
eukprot:2044481-Prymnesium_polylepis.1